MKDFDFRPGYKVFCLENGNGLVVRVSTDKDEIDEWMGDKIIGVSYDAGDCNGKVDNYYTKDGRFTDATLRVLYHGNDLEVIVKEKPPTRENEHWLCVYHDLKNPNIARSIIYSSYAEAIEKSKEDWSDDWEIIHGPVKIETKEVENEKA